MAKIPFETTEKKIRFGFTSIYSLKEFLIKKNYIVNTKTVKFQKFSRKLRFLENIM